MDRYVIKERRAGTEYPQGNQMIAFSAGSTIGNNITIPVSPSLYYGACGEIQGVPTNAGFVNVNMNTPRFVPNMVQNPGHIVSGIDPSYLAGYSSENMTSIAGPTVQHIQQDHSTLPSNVLFGNNYQNHNFYPVEKVAVKQFPQSPYPQGASVNENLRIETQVYGNRGSNKIVTELQSPQKFTAKVSATTRKQSEVNLLKNEAQYRGRSRSEKLKALHKSGPRAFSGSVENVLKWHKSLQDIGLLVLYEIVAKCVSVRPGERCAKNIVVRDDNGPAMQVVYYEVDFFLPELKPPCTIRVIGRMMPGTFRLQAFNVRIATGDDVSILPRRAAVAAHHVAKLCKEYGKDSLS